MRKVFLLMLAALLPASAIAAGWKLPMDVDDSNTRISFRFDSPIQPLSGSTTGLSGKVWLRNPNDPLSITSAITIPVSSLKIDRSAQNFSVFDFNSLLRLPDLILRISELRGNCLPAALRAAGGCNGTLLGSVSSNARAHDIEIPCQIRDHASYYELRGAMDLDFSRYNATDATAVLTQIYRSGRVDFSSRIPARVG